MDYLKVLAKLAMHLEQIKDVITNSKVLQAHPGVERPFFANFILDDHGHHHCKSLEFYWVAIFAFVNWC